ncbi:protein spindle-F [Trichogramma pretiosum]|uniref:protein spindle-F n=1 Tax=Trichogramma pretiosum TaxID=7493 RepID=UPI0006C984DC|nr:protein spindle-F [Trichogramma pretiosum]XP_014236456.1 protein spindle-F [Trichogramma pretiosum]
MADSNTDTLKETKLKFALQVVKERSRKLQRQLANTEEENSKLRQLNAQNNQIMLKKLNEDDKHDVIREQQQEIEELKKQKSQLLYHLLMVSSENQQLWKTLTKNNTAIDVSAMPSLNLKELSYPSKTDKNNSYLSEKNEKDCTLEEISLQLFDSIMIDKTDLKQLNSKILDLQKKVKENIDITCTADNNTYSLEQLTHHDNKLVHMKELLLDEQKKLKQALQNFSTISEKKNACTTCKSINDKLNDQTETDFDVKTKEIPDYSNDTCSVPTKEIPVTKDDKICPLCGYLFEHSVPFDIFHEHVIAHFTGDG